MLQRYCFQVKDRTGRVEESTGMGNTVEAAARAVLINAGEVRAMGGLGMMQPEIVGMRLVR